MIDARKMWIGVAISVVFLVLFLITVDLGRMVDALADAEYIYLAPAVALYLASLLFRTIRWQVLMRHMRPVKVRRLYPVVVVGYMANNLLPMRLGEVVRSYHVGEREGVSKTAALATIFVERVLDALTLLFFVAVIAVFVPLEGVADFLSDRFGLPWPLLVAAFSVPFLALFGLLMLSALFPRVATAAAAMVIERLPARFRSPLSHAAGMFLEGLVPLRDPRTLILLFILSVPIWLLESGLFVMVGFSFGLDDTYDSLGDLAVAQVLVTAIANIGSSIPAAPGSVGLFEFVAREALVAMPMASVDRAVAGGFAAVVHLALVLPVVVLGQVFLWAEHLSLRKLSQTGQEQESATVAGSLGLEDSET